MDFCLKGVKYNNYSFICKSEQTHFLRCSKDIDILITYITDFYKYSKWHFNFLVERIRLFMLYLKFNQVLTTYDF